MKALPNASAQVAPLEGCAPAPEVVGQADSELIEDVSNDEDVWADEDIWVGEDSSASEVACELDIVVDAVVGFATLGLVDDAAVWVELRVLILTVATFEFVDISPVETTLLEMPPIDVLGCPVVIMPEPLDIPVKDVILGNCGLEEPISEAAWLIMLLDVPADELWTPACDEVLLS